ncbi:hypothetical protein EVAR_100161_1 [Eumeta japonica]|uniref:Uncharacterized protein n=1 Tax=Eumeta variegata TaxID=151549 RepID=A0A4C1ZNB1_EUMVA|nr:hypothetical protein EVAR_100161_1 [Eumeta japonica]
MRRILVRVSRDGRMPKAESLFIYRVNVRVQRCGWESLMKSVTLGNVTMSHRTRGPPNALRLPHSTMIGLPRAALENSA